MIISTGLDQDSALSVFRNVSLLLALILAQHRARPLDEALGYSKRLANL